MKPGLKLYSCCFSQILSKVSRKSVCKMLLSETGLRQKGLSLVAKKNATMFRKWNYSFNDVTINDNTVPPA